MAHEFQFAIDATPLAAVVSPGAKEDRQGSHLAGFKLHTNYYAGTSTLVRRRGQGGK